VEIKEGLSEGDKVVTSANFLIDAESNLKAALSGFNADGKPPADAKPMSETMLAGDKGTPPMKDTTAEVKP
ncbi:hypothetical protein ACO1MY_13190, partial [Staphylococcus aureus]